MPKFMFVMRGNYDNWEKIIDTEKQKLLQKYQEYFKDLKENHNFVSGSHLSNISQKIEKAGDELKITQEPYKNTTEALNGFFILELDSMENAIEISKECPCLTHGENIEVIQMG